jgi:hypothetical protein
MTENDQPSAEFFLGGGDAAVHLVVGQADIPLRQRLPLAEVFFFVRRENRQ